MPEQNSVPRPALALALVGLGLASEGIAGWAIWGNRLLPGITLHLAAACLWNFGMAFLEPRASTLGAVPGQSPSEQGPAPGGLIAFNVLLGLLLFPGIGTLGCTLAAGLARLLGGASRPRADPDDEAMDSDSPAEIYRWARAPFQPLAELETQPLVDSLKKSDPAAKRSALERICREPGPRSLALARAFLADSNPDVRALAAVAVSRLEAQFSQLLKAAVARRDRQPRVARHHAALGRLYSSYGGPGAVDPVTRRLYLIQARAGYEGALALEPGRQSWRRSLAKVLIALGEEQKAWTLIEQLVTARPQDAAGYLLGMEMAFDRRRFEVVVALAQRAGRIVSRADKDWPLLQWWQEAGPTAMDAG